MRLAAEILSKLAMLGLFGVLARELGPLNFGDFVFAVSISILITALGGVGTDEIVARHVGRDASKTDEVLWAALSLKLAVGVLAVLAASVVGLIGGYGADVRVTLALVAASGCLDLLSNTLYSVFQGLNDLKPEAITRTTQAMSRAALGIAVLIAGGGIAWLAAVYVFTSLGALVLAIRFFVTRVGTVGRRVGWVLVRRLAVTGLPIAVGALFEVVVLSTDTVILSVMKGNDAVGLFGAASRLVEGTLVLSTSLVAAMVPVLVRAGRERPQGVRGAYETGNKVMVALLLPVSLTFILFAEPLLLLVYGSGFVPATTCLRLLGATVVVYGLSQLAFSSLIAINRQSAIPWIGAVAAVVDIGLTIALVPDHSVNGAAAATLVAATTYALLAVGLTIRHAGWISLGRVLVAPAVGALFMTLVAWVLGPTLLGAALALVAYGITELLIERRSDSDEIRWAASLFLRRRP